MIRFTPARIADIERGLGYSFTDKQLLRHALTHSSTVTKRDDYQRLEFLGDRVLGLVIADVLFRQNPDLREGSMANLHSNLVRGEVCGQVAQDMGLGDYIVMGANEQKKGVNQHVSVLGDVMEALIAGIFLDGGLEKARAFILAHWGPYLAARSEVNKDAKTFLQEWALGKSLPLPVYSVVKREGLEHRPVFTVELVVKGKDKAVGQGASKRLAEMDAATLFLRREGLRA